MATSTQDITFIIPGQAQTAGAAVRGNVKAAVRVGAQRGGGDPVRVTARPGDDVVVLSIANGPTLYLHPEDARDLMRAQSAGATRGTVNAADDNEVLVSAQLGWPGLEAGATRGTTRGWMGQAVLSAFEVITGLVKDPARLAAAAVTKKVDGGVEAGVYELSADALALERTYFAHHRRTMGSFATLGIRTSMKAGPPQTREYSSMARLASALSVK